MSPKVKIALLERIDTIIGAIDWLIANPEAQTTRAIARNSKGAEVLPTAKDACQWCLVGRVAHDLKIKPRLQNQIAELHDDKQALLSATYYRLGDVIDSLGMDLGAFVIANDNPMDAEARMSSLKQFSATLRKRREKIKAEAA